MFRPRHALQALSITLLGVCCATAQAEDSWRERWGQNREERLEKRAQRKDGAAVQGAEKAQPTATESVTRVGCEGQPIQPGMNKFEFEFAGNKRSYELHVPRSFDGRTPMPLVLSFHGGGGRGKSQRDLTGFEILGEREGFITAYPDGIRRSWNGGDGDTSYAEKNHLDDVGFASALIDDISRRTCVDPRRVYASGFSNGGRLTQRLGCELSDRLAAIAPVASPMPIKIGSDCNPKRPISVIQMHATTDPRSPYNGGATDSGNVVVSVPESIAGWVARNGCPATPKRSQLPQIVNDGTSVSIDEYTGCRDGVEVVLYSIEGAGHTWAGGKQYMSEKTIGKTSRQFHASEAIWKFFQRHPMPGG